MNGITCACVSHDAFECARKRDMKFRDCGDVDEDLDPPRRECECCCHDNYEDDDWDFIVAPPKPTMKRIEQLEGR